MATSQLRKCPACAQPWPHGERFALRGFGWLGDLPRGISISNIDGIIHDGKGEDRFLVLEEKGPEEWPVQGGQLWLLRALASIPNFTVRILRGTPDEMLKYRVTAEGLQLPGTAVSQSQARSGIIRWIDPTADAAPPIALELRRGDGVDPFDDPDFLKAWDDNERRKP